MKDYESQREMDVQCLSSCFMCFRDAIKRELEGFADEFFPFFENLDLSSGTQELARNIYLPWVFVRRERQRANRHSWRANVAFTVSAIGYFSIWDVFDYSDGH